MNTDKGYIRIEDNERVRQKHKNSLIRQTSAGLGICEHLRFIYDTVAEADIDDATREKLTDQLVDALIMAKKMNKRLVYYYRTYQDKTGTNGSKFNRLQANTSRIRMRRNREL